MTESCLSQRLGFFLDLTEGERDFVARMEGKPQQMARGEILVPKGATSRQLYVVKWGWVIVSAREFTGRRAILRTYLPGEIIGLAEIGSPEAPHDVIMLTDGSVCPFPRSSLGHIYEDAPRLAALLMAISSSEQVILRELLFAVGRMAAEDRLILFLLTLLDRLSVAGAGKNARFHLPLSQTEIADALGLTPVYVSRLFAKLRGEGFIEIADRHVRLRNRETLEQRVGYSPLATRIDTAWFPKPRPA